MASCTLTPTLSPSQQGFGLLWETFFGGGGGWGVRFREPSKSKEE